MPLPVSRIRDIGLVQVQPDKIEKILAPVPGNRPTVLKKLLVRPGQYVEKGQTLAEFSSLDLQMKYPKLRRNYALPTPSSWPSMRNPRRLDPDEQQRLRMRGRRQGGENELHPCAPIRWPTCKREMEIKSPLSGIVMSPPKADEVGKLFEKGATFCSVGDPSIALDFARCNEDYRILEDDVRRARKLGQELDITIRIKGRGNQTWKGRITELPESDAKDVPAQLTTKYGGPLAVKQSQNPNVHAPQSQVFLVYVDLLDPDDAICPGTMAYVKIHCHWRTGAWWIWRTFSSAFDLGADWRSVLPSFMRSKD